MVGSDDSDAVPVLVTVVPDRRPDITELVDRMRATGMTVGAVLSTVGVVTGTATPTQASAVAALPGVAAVEPDRTVHTWRQDPGSRPCTDELPPSEDEHPETEDDERAGGPRG